MINLHPHFLCRAILFVLTPVLLAGQSSAVVIGIADFQDPAVTDLKYADNDARVFAEYLQNPVGGGVDAERIKLLTDSSATLAAIQSALAWQLTVAVADQPAYLYIATHGDVEAAASDGGGYLLAHDTPRNNYDLLALGVAYLDDHLAALSALGALPILITDACHAGTLAGDGVAGRQLTATQLMQRRASEVRLLSCQPYELSREDKRWGGGRGVFSYYLERGLRGAADEDQDHQVDLFELERYVQEKVSADTDRKQHPELAGGRKDLVVATVSGDGPEGFLEARTVSLEANLEEAALALAPAEAQRDYVRFSRALHAGALIYPKEQSALAYYRQLRREPKLITLRGLLDERITIVLLDSVQQAIVSYLDSDPGELSDRDRIDDKYRVFPEYLAAAAGILGKDDPRIPVIRAKEAYFRGLVLRLEGDRSGSPDSLYREALRELTTAVSLEPEAAYHHNELGLLQLRLKQTKEAHASFVRATELAPTWALPYSNLGILLKQADADKYYQEAAGYFTHAIALKPDLAGAYLNYGNLLQKAGRRDSAELLLRQALALKPGETYARYNLASLIGRDGKETDEPLATFADIIRENGALVAESHYESGRIYRGLNNTDSAEVHFLRAAALQPEVSRNYTMLREVYTDAGQSGRAENYFAGLIHDRPDFPLGYLNLALLDTTSSTWLRLLRSAPLADSAAFALATGLGFTFYWAYLYRHAEESLLEAIRTAEDGLAARYTLSALLAATGREKGTLAAMKETLRFARDDQRITDYCRHYLEDADFESVRETEAYRKLYQRYCGGLPPPD